MKRKTPKLSAEAQIFLAAIARAMHLGGVLGNLSIANTHPVDEKGIILKVKIIQKNKTNRLPGEVRALSSGLWAPYPCVGPGEFIVSSPRSFIFSRTRVW